MERKRERKINGILFLLFPGLRAANCSASQSGGEGERWEAVVTRLGVGGGGGSDKGWEESPQKRRRRRLS